jgi:TolA protein
LDKARSAAKPPQGAAQVKPNSVAQALAAARKLRGSGAGAGGEGEGGGLGDVYISQIVMAVQQNWEWPALAHGNLSVVLFFKLNAAGRVLDVRVEESSGNAAFDSSAVSAVRVTQMPPPPGPAYHEIILRFFPMQ